MVASIGFGMRVRRDWPGMGFFSLARKLKDCAEERGWGGVWTAMSREIEIAVKRDWDGEIRVRFRLIAEVRCGFTFSGWGEP